jgi:hypothetical protein
VLGVADHFTRTRQHFVHMFSAFTLLKTLRAILRTILRWLRVPTPKVLV